MAELPTEILTYIFSLIRDGGLLLDVIPLVCRRWRDVVRDPRCWASVRVSLETVTPKHGDPEPPRSLRLLARAYGLGYLQLIPAAEGEVISSSVASALRDSRAVVSTLKLLNGFGLDEDYARIMTRSAKHLHSLTAVLLGSRPGSRLPDWKAETLLRPLPGLQRLEVLHLSVDPYVEYGGELEGAAWPRLRELRLAYSQSDFTDGTDKYYYYSKALAADAELPCQAKLFVDLLVATAATLEAVGLIGGWLVPATILRRLQDCPRLRTLQLSAPCLDVEAAPAILARVAFLTLDVHPEEDFIGQIQRALRRCAELPALESVSFKLVHLLPEEMEVVRDECQDDVLRLTTLRPTLECEFILEEPIESDEESDGYDGYDFDDYELDDDDLLYYSDGWGWSPETYDGSDDSD